MTERPLYPKADILSAGIDVCQVPETDIRISDAALPPKVDFFASSVRLLLFEKPTHDRGCDRAAAHSIGAA
jgi:hypothetical protein